MSNRDKYWSEFGKWLRNQGYFSHDGCHLAISDHLEGGLADIPRLQGGSSFVDPNKAVMGTQVEKKLIQGSIMETMHTFIRHDYDEVNDLIRDENEYHDFGTITDNGNQVTPMATGYTGPYSPSTYGNCGNNYWYESGYTQSLTWCTKEAVRITATKDT